MSEILPDRLSIPAHLEECGIDYEEHNNLIRRQAGEVYAVWISKIDENRGTEKVLEFV